MTYELTASVSVSNIFKYYLLQEADVVFSLSKLTKTYAAVLLRYIFSSEPYYLASMAIILLRKGGQLSKGFTHRCVLKKKSK